MNLKGQIVMHKSLGKGAVTEHDGKYLTISFSDKVSKFVFPDAFENFLIIDDEVITKQIMDMLDNIKQDKEKVRLEQEMQQKQMNEKKQEQLICHNKPRSTKVKIYPRYNIAFKCNYCDGGKSDTQVGFNGVCSDATIYNNIVVEKKAWCNDVSCDCLRYHNGEISRKALEQIFVELGSLCYESVMLRDWKAEAGVVQRGEKRGTPLKMEQVQNNSLCILTTRNPDSTEAMRYVFGVFLADENYDGDSREAGYVTTTSRYKIKLAPAEAKKILFWNYHKNDSDITVPRWSSGLFRYFEDEQAVQILKDIIKVKHGTKDEILATEFLEHFCRINDVDIKAVGKPQGALMLR